MGDRPDTPALADKHPRPPSGSRPAPPSRPAPVGKLGRVPIGLGQPTPRPSTDPASLAVVLRVAQWEVEDLASLLPAGRVAATRLTDLAERLSSLAGLLRAASTHP